MVKSLKRVVKTLVVEGLAGYVRERKRYQTNIQNESKIHLESIQNQCENDAQKSDAKMVENCAKMDAER